MSERDYPTYDEIKEAQRQLAHDYSCSRDHCTSEERAVINLAIELSCGFFSVNNSFWRGPSYSNETESEFLHAVQQLLATRSKSEVRG